MKRIGNDKKRVIIGIIAVFLALIMVLGMAAPFIMNWEIKKAAGRARGFFILVNFLRKLE